MVFLMLILCVIPAIVTSITVSSNGNSPKIKMIGGMMVDVHERFTTKIDELETVTTKSQIISTPKLNENVTKLSINERYRRLIPYMTFYYANNLATPTTEAYDTKSVEVEKAEIHEANMETPNEREPKKIVYSSYRNIPRYQGNRLTQFNIASANPTKPYKGPGYHYGYKEFPQYNSPYLSEHTHQINHDYVRLGNKHTAKFPISYTTKKPYLNFYNNEDTSDVKYYLGEKDFSPQYKLVPYEQAPPVKVSSLISNERPKRPFAVPVLIHRDNPQIASRPVKPQYYYEPVEMKQPVRKLPTTISESYYERRPHQEIVDPVIEGGFKPILPTHYEPVTDAPIYTSTVTESLLRPLSARPSVKIIENDNIVPIVGERPNHYELYVDQPAYKPKYAGTNTINIGNLLNSLQFNKSIPKPITKDNVGSSIRTLLQVLNILKASPQINEVESPVLSTPQPFLPPKVALDATPKPVLVATPTPISDNDDFHEEHYLAPVNIPSQHLDEFHHDGGSSQRFPLPVLSDDEGGTPGRPGVDYPTLTTIPHTAFNCKTQRYKGFFADPESRCQVWHYCDLNGGQASFLCPNGTIFSQAGLTCDWWFNVRCDNTAQLYVLNESLYKYILPHSPKFPEDYSGPLVDKYLTLKFKEMEEQFRKNKNKAASEKVDSDENNESNEETADTDSSSTSEVTSMDDVSEASVLVDTAGVSGNVERLHD